MTLAANSQNINSTIMISMKKFMSNSDKSSEQLLSIMHQLNSTLARMKLTAYQFDITRRSMKLTVRDAHTTMQNVSTQMMPSVQ